MERYVHSPLAENLKDSPRLAVDLFGTKLSSPLIVGSGTLIERVEDIDPFVEAGAGAVIPRSTRMEMVRKVHPSPHLYQSGRKGNEMMLNAEWTGTDIEFWEPHLDNISKKENVIMSVSGRDIEGCVEVCKVLDKFAFPMLEVNISCAHSNSVHGFITRNGDHIKQVVTDIKNASIKTPIGIKLGHSDYIVELSQIAKDAGADAIVALNTFGPVFDFTIEQGGLAGAVLGIEGAKGGVSGFPLFNIALTDIADIRSQVGISVIGCGGVSTAEHVAKMMMAGASAVQVYTSAHVRGINAPSFFSEMNGKLIKLMDNIGVDKISDLKDKALDLLSQETNIKPIVPEVNIHTCTGCDICIPVCLPLSITKVGYGNKAGHIVKIDDNSCVGCGHCVAVCPVNALSQK